MKICHSPALLAGLIACAGCSHIPQRAGPLKSNLNDPSRRWTAIINGESPGFPGRENNSEAARLWALPPPPDEVAVPSNPSTNSLWKTLQRPVFDNSQSRERQRAWPAQNAATAPTLEQRLDRIQRLLEQRQRLDQKWIEDSQRIENRQSRIFVREDKSDKSAPCSLGGVIALVLLFAMAIPIAGRLLAWSVGRFPRLASVTGVISVRAFDAIVRAIEKSRETAGTQILPNQTFRPSDTLELSLSREMDAEHKTLVRARKAALRL